MVDGDDRQHEVLLLSSLPLRTARMRLMMMMMMMMMGQTKKKNRVLPAV